MSRTPADHSHPHRKRTTAAHCGDGRHRSRPGRGSPAGRSARSVKRLQTLGVSACRRRFETRRRLALGQSRARAVRPGGWGARRGYASRSQAMCDRCSASCCRTWWMAQSGADVVGRQPSDRDGSRRSSSRAAVPGQTAERPAVGPDGPPAPGRRRATDDRRHRGPPMARGAGDPPGSVQLEDLRDHPVGLDERDVVQERTDAVQGRIGYQSTIPGVTCIQTRGGCHGDRPRGQPATARPPDRPRSAPVLSR